MAGMFPDAPLAMDAWWQPDANGVYPAGTAPMEAKRARTMGESILAEWERSATGLLLNRKMPKYQIDEDTPWYNRLAGGAAGVIADLPLGVAAAIPGGAAGAAATGGNPLGAAAGAGMMGFGVTMGIRDALLEAYGGNHALTFTDAVEVAKKGAIGFAKGATIGGVTLGAGAAVTRTAGTAIAPMVGSAMTGKTAGRVLSGLEYATEVGTMTTIASALEGQMPTAASFMDNALLVGGQKVVIGTVMNMRKNYAETGKTPEQQYADAAADPKLRAALTRDPKEAMEAARKAAVEDPNAPKQPDTSGIILPAGDKAAIDAATRVPEAYRPLALEERIRAVVGDDPKALEIGKYIAQVESSGIKLGEAPLNKEIRIEYITNDDVLKGTLRILEDKAQAEIQAARGGTIGADGIAVKSMAATAREALSDLNQGRLPTGSSDARMAALYMLMKEATQDVTNKAHEYSRLTAVEKNSIEAKLKLAAATERLVAIRLETARERAEWGRAGAVMAEYSRDPNTMKFPAEGLIKLLETKAPMEKVAEMILSAKDGASLGRGLENLAKATTKEKLIYAFKSFIYSGPLTQTANALGGAMKVFTDLVEKPLAASFYAAQRAGKGDAMTMAEYKARALAPINGIVFASRDLFAWVGATYKEANFNAGMRGESTGLITGLKGIAAEAKAAGADMKYANEKAEVYRRPIDGKLGAVLETPFLGLRVTDAIFRIPAERAEAYLVATERALSEKYMPGTKEYNTAIAKYMSDPTVGLTQKEANVLTNRIDDAGQRAVFSERLSANMEKHQQAMQGTWMEILIPAVRTPANLLSWTVQRFPGTQLMSQRWKDDFASPGPRRSEAIARLAVGGTIAIGTLYAFESGLLTGGGLFDKPESGTKRGANWQPYSLKVGGEYYSYQRMEPVGKVMALAADLTELVIALKNGNHKDEAGKLASMLVLLMGNVTISSNYLSGLSNFMNAVLDPERYGENWVESLASAAVPKIIGQTAAMADPYKREVEGAFQAIQSQIPFARELLLPKRDVWGEKMQNDRLFTILPIATSVASQEKVKTEAMRLQLAISDAPKYLSETGPFKQKDRKFQMEPDQRDIMREVAGKNAMAILSPFVNSPDWDTLPDYAQANIIKGVIQDVRKGAEYAAVPADSAEREKVRKYIISRIEMENVQAETKTKPERRIKAQP